MLDHGIVDATIALLSTGPGGYRLLPAKQAALAERLLADPSLVEATRALYLLAVRLKRRGHAEAAADVVEVAKRAHERLPEHLAAATQHHERMLLDFHRVCDRATTWRAPVYGTQAAPSGRGGFQVRSLPRPKLR